MKQKSRSRAEAIRNLNRRVQMLREANDAAYRWAQQTSKTLKDHEENAEALTDLVQELGTAVLEWLELPWWKRALRRFRRPKSWDLSDLGPAEGLNEQDSGKEEGAA